MREVCENVLRNIESLRRVEQLRLISHVAERLRVQRAAGRGGTILDLQGLAKEIWQGIDAHAYVDRRRRMEWLNSLCGTVVGLDTAPLIYFIEEHATYLPVLVPPHPLQAHQVGLRTIYFRPSQYMGRASGA